MLRYLGSGVRRFGDYPIPVHHRSDWEFFAVIRGRCGLALSDDQKPLFREKHFWIVPPETPHGWAGDGRRRCEVAVFHFGAVPALLEKVSKERGYLDRPLTNAQTQRISELGRQLRSDYEHVTEKSLLVFEKALLELSLLALEEIAFAQTETKSDRALRRVEASLTWYSEHMAEQPKLEHVAQAIHVSVSHLRRLFWRARQESPQKAFTKLRLQRAMELLSHSDLKLDDVAANCGFSGSSDFCRVFKDYHKISPNAWRRSKLGPYSEPDSTRK